MVVGVFAPHKRRRQPLPEVAARPRLRVQSPRALRLKVVVVVVAAVVLGLGVVVSGRDGCRLCHERRCTCNNWRKAGNKRIRG